MLEFLINSNLHLICDQEVGLSSDLNVALLSGAMVISIFHCLEKVASRLEFA